MSYLIRDCRLADLRGLARTLRPADRAEIEGLGLTPRQALFRLWRGSLYRRAALVEGAVAACWGDAAGALDREGQPWLFTAPPVARLPLAFFREARREIARLCACREVLRAHVAEDYGAARRFFALLGFQIVPSALPGYAELRRERG